MNMGDHETHTPPVKSYLVNYFALAAVLLLAVYGLCLLVGLFVPLHVDESLIPFTYIRAGFDNWKLPCVTFAMDIPWIFMPGRWLGFIGHDWIRHPSIARAATFLLLLGFYLLLDLLLRRQGVKLHWVLRAALLVLGMTLGELPFLSLVNRSEVPILLCIAFFVALPYLLPKCPAKYWPGYVLVIYVMLSWLLTAHPKTFFLLPLIFISLAQCYRKHQAFAVSLAIITALLAFFAYRYWMEFTGCFYYKTSDVSSLPYMSGRAIVEQPLAFIKEFYTNVTELPRYVRQMIYSAVSPWRIHQISPAIHTANTMLIYTVWTWIVLVGIAGLGLIGLAVKDRGLRARALLFIGVLGVIVAQLGMQNVAPSYDSLYLAGLFTLLGALALPVITQRLFARLGNVLYPLLIALCLISLVSMTVLLARHLPLFFTDYTQISGHAGRKPYLYNWQVERVTKAAEQCGIYPDGRSSRIILSKTTYLPMRSSSEAVMLAGALERSFNPHVSGILRNYRVNANGVVMECDQLPGDLRQKARKYDRICCLNSEMMKPN